MNPGLSDRLFVGLQHLLPQHLLSGVMRRFARVRARPVKDLTIRSFLLSPSTLRFAFFTCCVSTASPRWANPRRMIIARSALSASSRCAPCRNASVTQTRSRSSRVIMSCNWCGS